MHDFQWQTGQRVGFGSAQNKHMCTDSVQYNLCLCEARLAAADICKVTRFKTTSMGAGACLPHSAASARLCDVWQDTVGVQKKRSFAERWHIKLTPAGSFFLLWSRRNVHERGRETIIAFLKASNIKIGLVVHCYKPLDVEMSIYDSGF